MKRKISRVNLLTSTKTNAEKPKNRVAKASEYDENVKTDVKETENNIEPEQNISPNKEIQKVGNVCILAIARDEEKYIDEWLEWHFNLGFDYIFILDNNPLGKELRIEDKRVTIIPYNGVEFEVFNVDQCNAYNYALEYIKKLDYDFISVIDIDEFFDFNGMSVKKFIEFYVIDAGINMCEVMWKTYSDNDIIYEADCKKSVVETYTKEVTTMKYDTYDRVTSNEISWGKPIMKVIPELKYGTNPHIPEESVFNKHYETKILPRSIANLKHYRTKCLETYIRHKVINAKADIANYTKKGKNIVDGYFMFNEKNKKKAIAFLRLCKEYNYTLSEIDKRTIYNIINGDECKVAVCCIAKNENKYIKEWADHYKKLGFDKIIIYDNNDENGEILEDVLSEETNSKFVEIINYRGMFVKAQQHAYSDCYKKYGDKYDWIAFFDCDEFLELTTAKDIKEYLSNKIFIDYDLIKINWETYTDSGNLHYEDKPVVERFKEKYVSKNDGWSHNFHIKSILRGGLNQEIVWMESHSPALHNLPTCDNCGGEIIPLLHTISYGTNKYDSCFNKNVNYNMAKLKHYTTKSVEEYCNKLKRGYPDREYGHNFDDLSISKYFEVNEETNKKRILFKNLLGLKTIMTNERG